MRVFFYATELSIALPCIDVRLGGGRDVCEHSRFDSVVVDLNDVLVLILVLPREVAALEDGQSVLHGTDLLPDAGEARPRFHPRGTQEHDGDEGEEGEEGERRVDSGHLFGSRIVANAAIDDETTQTTTENEI